MSSAVADEEDGSVAWPWLVATLLPVLVHQFQSAVLVQQCGVGLAQLVVMAARPLNLACRCIVAVPIRTVRLVGSQRGADCYFICVVSIIECKHWNGIEIEEEALI